MRRRGVATVKRVTQEALQKVAINKPAGYLDEVMAASSKVENGWVHFEDAAFRRLLKKYSPERLSRGPGTVLHDMLSIFGIHIKPGCQCRARMEQMNKWGCKGCEENIDTIVGWLAEEAANRGLPYISTVGRMLVRRAIHNARKEAERAKDPPH
jgi:hypothetical protein